MGAPVAWQLAPRLCRAHVHTGEDCSSAHGVWQYLRLLGLANIETRQAFYCNALQAMAATTAAPRILISGCADYAMLHIVHTAFHARGIAADITLADRCETPLAINRWYAGQTSRSVATVHRDILQFDSADRFDAICTDYFLSWFPAAARRAVVEKWRDLLHPGGYVMTTSRLWPTSAEDVVRFPPGDIATLRATVERAARDMQPALDVDALELAARVADYASGYRNHAIRTPDEVRALFEENGFAVSDLSVHDAPERSAHGATGAVNRGGPRRYLTIVAHRL
jgi:SAM-dependent methyltransferase